MAERPTFHADLGSYFLDLRLNRGWGQRQAAELATRRGLSPLDEMRITPEEKAAEIRILNRLRGPYPSVQMFSAAALASHANVDTPTAHRLLEHLQEEGLAKTACDEVAPSDLMWLATKPLP